MTEVSLTTTGIDHIVLHVRDPEHSKKFYVDVLGMAVDHEYPGHVFLRCGSQLVGLFTAREPGGFTPHNDVNHLALNVEAGSYEDIRSHLEAAGIEVRGRPGDEHCIYFEDPDGHTLQIVVPNAA
ncbi:MAG: VOC family protein [Alphaproteobacteria bacterium]|nr:VOC family protein [Alphaproteobacteria bacterium]